MFFTKRNTEMKRLADMKKQKPGTTDCMVCEDSNHCTKCGWGVRCFYPAGPRLPAKTHGAT